MVFGEPDQGYWLEHATSIVDATVSGFDRQALTKPGDTGTSFQGVDTWVLKLNVHNTLRGDSLDLRLVATRFWNSTIVNEKYIQDFVGKRKEFALVGVPISKSTSFGATSLGYEFPSHDGFYEYPPHDGFHVRDQNGRPIDEIWEGLCVALPIFDLGTFER